MTSCNWIYTHSSTFSNLRRSLIHAQSMRKVCTTTSGSYAHFRVEYSSSSNLSVFDAIVSRMEMYLTLFPGMGSKEIDLFIIDYIQLFARLVRNQFKGNISQFEIVAHIARYLKIMTQIYKNRGITIIALSQINRNSFSAIKARVRDRKINPLDKYKNIYDLTSIAESSELVNAADYVVTIYTDDVLKKQNVAVIQLLKNRFGESIEEGVKILALPEIAYIGDFKDESTFTDQNEFAIYINGLINGTI